MSIRKVERSDWKSIECAHFVENYGSLGALNKDWNHVYDRQQMAKGDLAPKSVMIQ